MEDSGYTYWYHNLDHVYNWVGYSTSDNDQVKPARKDYVLLQCCNKQKSKKTQKFHVSKTPAEHYQIVIKFKIIRYGNIYIYIYIYKYIYIYINIYIYI